MSGLRARLTGAPVLTFLVCAALALNQIRATMETWGEFVLRHPGFSDFGSYYLYAQVGLHAGWNRLYDVAALRQEWLALGGADVIPWFPPIYPPPLAWLVAPFAGLPLPAAFAAWTVLLLSLLLVSWKLVAPVSSRLARWTALAATLALFPVLFALVLGQILVVEMAAVAAAWWLLARGREIPAGLLLTALVFKPQVAFLVPPALLLAGRWRAVLSWALASAGIGVVAVVTTGLSGLHVYADRLIHAAGSGPEFGVTTQFTLQGILGGGIGLRVAAVTTVVLAFAVAYRHRGEGVAVPVAAALLASTLITPYLHDQDLAVAMLAGGIAWHAPLDRWQRGLLLGGYAMLVVISYWGFGSAGAILGPLLVVVELAWLGAVWRVAPSGRRARLAGPVAQVPLDRTA